MASKPVLKSLSEFQDEAAEANEPGFDREVELGKLDDAGAISDDLSQFESDHDDDGVAKKSPVIDLGEIGWSEVAGALNIVGVLQRYDESAGTTNVNGHVRIHAPADPDIAGELVLAIGSMPFHATYAGKEIANGATIRRAVYSADADGDHWCDIDLLIPETERMKLANLVGLVRSRGVFALEPLQMSLDLTTKAT